MDYLIGDRIKDLREHLNISQKALSKDICTQGQISKIESNTTIPTAPLLNQIANRLGVDINYFFDDLSRNGIHYVQEAKLNIDKLIRNQNYHEVMYAVRLEKKNPLFRKPHLQQYLLWREGICIFHLYHDSVKAISLLDYALSLGDSSKKNPSETELDILGSKAVILSKINQFEEADHIYKSIYTKIEALPKFTNQRLLIRVLFNASRNAYDRKNYKDSLSYANKAIQICIEEEQLYLLGHLLFQKSCSLFQEDASNKDYCLELLSDALWVNKLHPNRAFATSLEEEIHYIKTS